jgi:hypothetical protein
VGRGCAAILAWIARTLDRMPRPIAAAATLAWMASIFWLSSDRRDLLPPGPLGRFGGNAAHAPIFGLLALLAARATGSTALGVAVAVGYGVADEWHQSFVPGRTPSAFDLGTDAVGAAVALWLVALPASLPPPAVARRVVAAASAVALTAALASTR